MGDQINHRVVDVEVPPPETIVFDPGLSPPIRKEMEDFSKYCEKLGWAVYSFATLNTLVTMIFCKYKYHDIVDRIPLVHRMTSSERTDVDEVIDFLRSIWRDDKDWGIALDEYKRITQMRNALFHSQRLPDGLDSNYLVRHHAHSDHSFSIQAWDSEGDEITHVCEDSEHHCAMELITSALRCGGSWQYRPALWESFVIDEDWLKEFTQLCHQVHGDLHGCWIRLDPATQENQQ